MTRSVVTYTIRLNNGNEYSGHSKGGRAISRENARWNALYKVRYDSYGAVDNSGGLDAFYKELDIDEETYDTSGLITIQGQKIIRRGGKQSVEMEDVIIEGESLTYRELKEKEEAYKAENKRLRELISKLKRERNS